MEQLIAHLVGDYLLQWSRMATRKVESWPWALLHGVVYTLPFVFITHSPQALAVICLSHAFIDRYSIGAWWKRVSERAAPSNDREGFSTAPAWLTTRITTIVDNTMHLAINALAILYL